MNFPASETPMRRMRWAAAVITLLLVTFPLWRGNPPPGNPRETAAPPPAAPLSADDAENGDLRAMPPSRVLPPVMDESVLNASLAALRAKGADLSRPMPSRHQIVCGDRAAAAKVAEWARAHGFTPEEPVAYNSHGGVERLLVDIVRSEIPAPAAILAEGRAVLAGMAGIDGAFYHTWMSASPP